MASDSIIIAAWYFPPDGGAGSQRPAAFARELPALGWKTTVVTRDTSHERGRWETLDESLLPQVGAAARIERAPRSSGASVGGLSSTLPVEARSMGDRLLEVARREQPSVVFLTMSPFFLADLVGPLREVCDARIVVDLRDPWMLDLWPIHRTRRSFRAEERRMLECFRSVDGVVMNTPVARTELLEVHGGVLPSGFEDRVGVIENGFTASDFEAGSRPVNASTLEIVHAGTFHCEHLAVNRSIRRVLAGLRHHSRASIDRTGRTPHHLLRAAMTLSNESSAFDRDVRFRFVGHVDPGLERCIAASGMQGKITLAGYQSHDEMVRTMCGAGALFLPGAGLPEGLEDLIVPGKTYEYLASGRPILGAIGAGDARRLLEKAGGAYICDPCDPRSIATQLDRLHQDWRGGGLDGGTTRDRAVLNHYDRSSLARDLDAFLRSIIDNDS
jgi:hypothetical protein